jgi:hypothetical protein
MWLNDLVEESQASLSEDVRETLCLRGVSDEQIDMYRIGYVGGDLPDSIGYPADFMKWWRGHQDKVTQSYFLPLTNWLGEVRGFQLRPVDRENKQYMDFFLDRAEPVLFGLREAAQAVWDTREVIIVEGAFDHLPVQRAAPNVISTLTANVSAPLVRSLKRFVDKVHVFYDNDKPGRDATEKFDLYHKSDFDINAWGYPIGVKLSNGKLVKDPGDLWEAWGDVRLAAYIKTQME